MECEQHAVEAAQPSRDPTPQQLLIRRQCVSSGRVARSISKPGMKATEEGPEEGRSLSMVKRYQRSQRKSPPPQVEDEGEEAPGGIECVEEEVVNEAEPEVERELTEEEKARAEVVAKAEAEKKIA